MLGLFARWRRSRLRKRALPAGWTQFLTARVQFFTAFDAKDRALFLDRLKVFVWSKAWIEAGGMTIDDECKVVIAAAAVRLTLRLDESFYDDLTEIVVYPSHYHHPDNDAVVFGEAHQWGTVVLSWDAVVAGLADPRDGHDTATHEFAHVLDRRGGRFDGTPELRAREHYRAWARVMSRQFEALRAGEKRQRRVLRDYGATNEAEFFAVATESFFEKPKAMKSRTPELYAEMSQFYGFDPVAEE